MLVRHEPTEVDFAADAGLVEHRAERVNTSASLQAGEAGWNSRSFTVREE